MKTKLAAICHLLCAICFSASAQGTAFSYQGRLNDSGNPANGIYDLRFTIYDAVTNGNLVAGPLTNTATGVTNGLFAVTLDFGGGVFTGAARWLELDVRTNGDGGFSALNPLQPITPTPYAIYSANAGTAATATSAITAATAGSANSVAATNIVGTVPMSATATNAPTGFPLIGYAPEFLMFSLQPNAIGNVYIDASSDGTNFTSQTPYPLTLNNINSFDCSFLDAGATKVLVVHPRSSCLE